MYINLEDFSQGTLADMVRDLGDKLSDAVSEKEHLEGLRNVAISKRDEALHSADESNRKFNDIQAEYNFLKYQNGRDAWREVCKQFVEAAQVLTDDQAHVVLGLVSEAGRKIEAIKGYRDRFGASLKESKEAIEQWRRRVGVPDR